MDKRVFVALPFLAAFLVTFAASAAEPSLSITGHVKAAQKLSFADLRALKQTHVQITQGSGHGPVALDCTGPAVSLLLDRAQTDFGAVKNAFVAHTLLFTADDGYAVALSMGEIDPKLGHLQAIVATDCAGNAEDAPRLIVAGDLEASRALRGLVSIEVK